MLAVPTPAHRGRRPTAASRRRAVLCRARPGLLGAAAAAFALLSAQGLLSELAPTAGGPSPLVHGPGLVVTATKPAAAATQAAAARAPQRSAVGGGAAPRAKRKKQQKPPQTVLKELINKKLDRVSGKKDVVYNLIEDAEKGRFRAVAELACLPGKPARQGLWADNDKDARHSAAQAVLNDPFLHAYLDKPVQNLRNIVTKHIKRQPGAGDVTYTVREDPSAAPEARFVATVELGALEGSPSVEGAPRKSETAAKWSAAEAVLLSPELQAQLRDPQAVKEPTALEILRMLVDRKLRRAVTDEDIVYVVEEREDLPGQARFRASVSLPFLKGKPVVWGKARPGWKRAKQAAAEAFLADPVERALLSSDPVADLRDLVNKKLRRKTLKDDVVYTVTSEEPTEAGASPTFRARAELRCLVGMPACEGEAADSEIRAKRSAAEALLEDPEVQRLLRSRDAAEVLSAAVMAAGGQ